MNDQLNRELQGLALLEEVKFNLEYLWLCKKKHFNRLYNSFEIICPCSFWVILPWSISNSSYHRCTAYGIVVVELRSIHTCMYPQTATKSNIHWEYISTCSPTWFQTNSVSIFCIYFYQKTNTRIVYFVLLITRTGKAIKAMIK